MKIFIGITQNQEELKVHLREKAGVCSSVTEIGPFLLKEDALQWLNYLKGNIHDLEEIPSKENTSQDGGWYGFTFEKV